MSCCSFTGCPSIQHSVAEVSHRFLLPSVLTEIVNLVSSLASDTTVKVFERTRCVLDASTFVSLQIQFINRLLCLLTVVLREISMSPCQTFSTSASRPQPAGASSSLAATSANGTAVQNKVPILSRQNVISVFHIIHTYRIIYWVLEKAHYNDGYDTLQWF